jgi:chemotaxis family two-component system response regulator Rcp1
VTSEHPRTLRLLHVEDNIGDVRLVAEALKEAGWVHQSVVVSDGIEALDYLRRRGQYTNASRPDLILLDLNLPKKSGLEVLAEIKSDTRLGHIPVAVFTTSSAPLDITRAYGLHASCYVTKPADLDDLFRVIAIMAKFWSNTAKLPQVIGL